MRFLLFLLGVGLLFLGCSEEPDSCTACNGSYAGRAQTAPGSKHPSCENSDVRFTVTNNTIEFFDFEANCQEGACRHCINRFSTIVTISNSCGFSVSESFDGYTLQVKGSVNPETCEFMGTYFMSSPPGCPCQIGGSWSASRLDSSKAPTGLLDSRN